MKQPDKKYKSFIIKVPVYCSEIITKGNDLFGGVTYLDMINHSKRKIQDYKALNEKVSRNKRNKIQKREIDRVDSIDCMIGKRPCLLLQISAYDTNLSDGYVETDHKVNLGETDKIGSENYFLLLVPNIIGVDANNYKHQWIIMVYEDPHKETQDIISTAKLVVNKILNISTANIKLPEILEDLRKMKKIPELSINFLAISNEENEVDTKYRKYLVNSKMRKQKEEKYENLPITETEEVINDTAYEDEFQKRTVKIRLGKKEYRITKDQKLEAEGKINEAVEEIFNESIVISKDELSSIYEPSFIIEKLTPILQNYLG